MRQQRSKGSHYIFGWETVQPLTVSAHFHVHRHIKHLAWYKPSTQLVPVVLPQHFCFNL